MKYSILVFSFLFMINSVFAQQSRNEHWYKKTTQFKEELKLIKKGGVVFLGNSIAEGFDFDNYFENTNIVNRGINSDHIDGLIERLQYSVINLQPSKLFLLIGINDIGRQDSDSTILSNYQQLLNLIAKQLSNTEVYVHSILPTTDRWKNCPPEKIVRLNKQIKEIVLQHKFTWVDIYSIFVNNNSFLKSDLTRDGLHLNSDGYLLWSKKLKEFGIN